MQKKFLEQIFRAKVYGIKTYEIARKIGITKQYLSMVCNGKKNGSEKLLKNVKAAVDELVAQRVTADEAG